MSLSSSHFKTIALGTFALLALTVPKVQAGHVYAGIIDTNGTAGLGLGDTLSFVSNATGAVVTGPSQGVQSMPYAEFGNQAGLYFTNNISYTALSNGLNWTGAGYRPAVAFAATSGSLIQLRISSVTGPNGAQFSFWDEGVSTTNPTATFTIGTGITAGTGIFNLTDISLIVGDGVNDGNGEPPTATNTTGVDPYGHIHGRVMTVNTPGDYTVNFILHDANGHHPDSSPFVVSYSTVPEPSALLCAGGGAAFLLFRRRFRR